MDGLGSEPLGLFRIVRPREIRVLGTNRLRVVVREQRGKIVAVLAEALEPGCERGVEPGAACLRQACVRDFPRERVLDRVLALAGDARPRP